MVLDATSLVSNCASEGNVPIVPACHALNHMVKWSLSECTRHFFQMKLSQQVTHNGCTLNAFQSLMGV